MNKAQKARMDRAQAAIAAAEKAISVAETDQAEREAKAALAAAKAERGAAEVAVSTPAPPPAPAGEAEAEKARRKAAKAEKAERTAAEKIERAAERIAERQAKAELKAAEPKPPCSCGCGGTTGGGRFLPGHDARLHGRIKRAQEDRLDWTPLTAEEAGAVREAIAAGHSPTGSFTPQPEKTGRTKSSKIEREVKVLEARKARLEAALATCCEELDTAKHLAGIA